MNHIVDWVSYEYFSNSMNYSFIGFVLGYLIGKLEVMVLNRFKGNRNG